MLSEAHRVAYDPQLNDDEEKSDTLHGPDSHGELTKACQSLKHRQQNSQGTGIDSNMDHFNSRPEKMP